MVKMKDKNIYTEFLYVINTNNFEKVKRLWQDHQDKIDICPKVDYYTEDPLHHALIYGSGDDIIKYLIEECGVNVNNQSIWVIQLYI